MDNFLRYFYQDIGRVFRAFADIFSAFFNFLNYLLNFPMRMKIIESYESEFGTTDWIMLLAANVLLILVIALLCWGLLKLVRKVFRFRVPVKEYEAMQKQVRALQRDLLRANYEKDKLLAMKVAQLGEGQIPEEELQDQIEGETEENQEEEEEYVPNSNRNTFQSPCVDPSESRFFRLTAVDNYYKTEYVAPVFNNEITLEEFCKQFRRYAASQLKLYYELDMMRYFIAAASSFCRVFPVPVKPPCPMPSASSSRETPPWSPSSPPGVSVPSFTATSTNLPRSIPRPSSSRPSTRATSTGIPTSSSSMR